MNDPGFIYVLANSAMPDMVKVGKTNRDPKERAEELSAVTGLPMPFIVVYEQLFSDCTEAEQFIHTYLANKGFRVTNNREFFNAPVNEVVRAIALAPGSLDESALNDEDSSDEADLLSNKLAGDELDDLDIQQTKVSDKPWTSIYNEAEMHYYGLGDYIQDYREAFQLYKKAAKLGCAKAYSSIGGMYANGEGVKKDDNKALEYYKEGARRGIIYCYWRMAVLFFHSDFILEDQTVYENAIKCSRLFIREMQRISPLGEGYPDDGELNIVAMGFAQIYEWSKYRNWFELPDDIVAYCYNLSDRIVYMGRGMIDRFSDQQDYKSVEIWRKVVADFS